MEGAPTDAGVTGTDDLSMSVQPQASSNFAQVSGQFRRMRRDAFKDGHGRPDYEDTSVPSKFVPTPAGPMGGIERQPKAMAGMGEFVTDPMQNLTSEGLQLEGRSYRERESRPGPRNDQSKYRSKGVAAYHKELRNG